MNKKFLIITASVAVVCLLIGFAAGYFTAGDSNVNEPDESAANGIVSEPGDTVSDAGGTSEYGTVFYAKILERNGNYFHVEGLSVNDINFRSEFTFSANEDTALIWRGTSITLDDLDVGDNISISFSGAVLESYPAQIKNVKVIKLLDDEK